MRALLISAVLLAAPALATSDDLRSVAGMREHARVLLVFAPTLRDPRLAEQRRIIARYGIGAAERNLVFVQVSEGQVLGAHDKDAKLRARFQTPGHRYRTLLLGTDGQVALDADRPVSEQQLTRAIDAMPMRRAEMAGARAGRPLPRRN